MEGSDLKTILLASAVYLLVSSAYVLAQKRIPSIGIWLLGYGLYAQMLLTQLKVFGMSPKVPALLFAGALAFNRALTDRNASGRLKHASVLMLPFLGFAIWIPINDSLAGHLSSATFAEVIGNQGFTCITLFAVIALAARREDLEFLLWILIVFVGASTLLSFLQFRDVGWAWDVYSAFRPISELDQTGTFKLATETLGFPGLCLQVVHQGYVGLAFGSFLLSYSLMGTKRPTRQVGGLLVFGSIVLSLYLGLSRSATGLFALITAAFPFLLMLHYGRLQIGRALLVCLLGFAAGIPLLQRFLGTQEFQGHNFSKMESFYSSERVSVSIAALNEIVESPFFGHGIESFAVANEIAPHNTLLNAGIAYGLVGMVLVLFYWWSLFWLWRFSFRHNKEITASSWISMGAFLGLVSYNLNGFAHNESIVTYGLTSAIVCGIWFNAVFSERVEQTPEGWVGLPTDTKEHAPLPQDWDASA